MSCTILLISGSLRRGSTNAAVLSTAQQLGLAGVNAVQYGRLADLPHFNPDDDRDPLPEPVAHLRIQLAASDAVLFSTPEYAGALPGSFKNLLDWTVGEGIHDKPVGWINCSAMNGARGTYEQLRTVLTYTNADIVDAACVAVPVARAAVDAESGVVTDSTAREAIRAALGALAARVALRRERTE
jgi:NAD(P)H-dependent FMN reductase